MTWNFLSYKAEHILHQGNATRIIVHYVRMLCPVKILINASRAKALHIKCSYRQRSKVQKVQQTLIRYLQKLTSFKTTILLFTTLEH